MKSVCVFVAGTPGSVPVFISGMGGWPLHCTAQGLIGGGVGEGGVMENICATLVGGGGVEVIS